MGSNTNYIQTVNGKISSKDLGYCQSHEHLFIRYGQSAKLVPSLWLDNLKKTCLELEMYKKLGGVAIVDAQPIGCGRMADYLTRASSQTNINIIASTGFHKLIFYPDNHWIFKLNDSDLANLFISEIELGMFTSCDFFRPARRLTSKAGVIKTASDKEGPTGKYVKFFESAAEASRQTGVPIMSHTEMGKKGLEQVKTFTDKHVPCESIIICHLDRDLTDLGYILSVAETGVFLEFDTIGRFKYHSDEAEAEFLLKLVEHGYEDRILIGLDSTRERMHSYGGLIGLDHILNSFIPLLKSYGLTDELINKFTVSNPAKAFTIKNKTVEGESK